MNPVVKGITSFMLAIDKLLAGLNKKTLDAIKAGFFFLIFVLTVAGGIIGYRNGIESAVIKNPPLIDTINDVFDIDIKRERGSGNFSAMLDTKLIQEEKMLEPNKVRYPSQEGMEMESQGGILEPDETEKAKVMPDMDTRPGLLEGEYRNDKRPDSQVRSLDKKNTPAEGGDEMSREPTAPIDDGAMKGPEDGRGSGEKSRGEKRLKPIQKSREGSPPLINSEKGIIDN